MTRAHQPPMAPAESQVSDPLSSTLIERPLTPEEVAQMMRVSCKTVMRAIHAGELEASQLTQKRGGWRIMPAAVEDWLQARSNRQRPPRPLPDVSRVEPLVRRRGARSPASSGSGTLAA